MDDPWCTRLAVMHLLHLVETGEDMEGPGDGFSCGIQALRRELARSEKDAAKVPA